MIRCIKNFTHNAEDSAYFCGRKPCLKSLLQFFEGGSKHTDAYKLLDVRCLDLQRDFDRVFHQGLSLSEEYRRKSSQRVTVDYRWGKTLAIVLIYPLESHRFCAEICAVQHIQKSSEK